MGLVGGSTGTVGAPLVPLAGAQVRLPLIRICRVLAVRMRSTVSVSVCDFGIGLAFGFACTLVFAFVLVFVFAFVLVFACDMMIRPFDFQD
jgi:hypothetical protein